MKIEIAKYTVDGSTVKAETLTKYDYLKKYRGRLKCNEDDCSALLSFVERRKHNAKYFRTWSKSKHKDGCPYEVLYDEDSSIAFGDNPSNLANLSDKHIIDRLKRAYENFISDKTFKKSERKTNNKKITHQIGSIIYPALFGEGQDINGKPPYILVRQFNKIDESDFDQTRCIIGSVDSIQLKEEFGYINLTRKQQSSVKVYFSKAFVKSEINRNQYPNFSLFNNYFLECRKNKTPVICCCVGKVKRVYNGINICPDRVNCITLNGLGYYDLFRRSAGL